MMLLKDKRIFIVEDNTHNRIVFQMALIRHGAVLHLERHGWDTLRQLKNAGAVDIVIMDLMLADGISGFAMAEQIRALPEYKTLPIVAVSAMDPAIAIPQVQAKGFAGFIAKPIDAQFFAHQIAKIIHGENVWSAGERDLT